MRVLNCNSKKLPIQNKAVFFYFQDLNKKQLFSRGSNSGLEKRVFGSFDRVERAKCRNWEGGLGGIRENKRKSFSWLLILGVRPVKPDQEESSFWWWPCGWCRNICPTFKLPYVRQSPILHWVFLQNIHQLPEWFHHDTGVYKITILGIFIPMKNSTNFRENYRLLSFRIFFGNNRDPCQLEVTTSSSRLPTLLWN